jgi:hypothetical protein
VQFFAQLMAGRKLFLGENGKPWQQSEHERPMDASQEAEGVTFHLLRHTFASHAGIARMTIEVLAQQGAGPACGGTFDIALKKFEQTRSSFVNEFEIILTVRDESRMDRYRQNKPSAFS